MMLFLKNHKNLKFNPLNLSVLLKKIDFSDNFEDEIRIFFKSENLTLKSSDL